MAEKRTVKFQMMMSDSEVLAIENWMFANRIKSRAEAIRRLCKMAIAHEAKGNADA
ncbi:hypothetical protein [Brucella anthropi]|uniref:hypothetical protein n=1 Tax=Brucella anthropi TaxID=529 RepID=UPI0032083BBE